MRRLGYVQDYDSACCFLTDIFQFIDCKIDQIREQERKVNKHGK